jgi:aspartate aminotransferase/aminotransferase
MLTKASLANRVDAIDASGIRRMFALAESLENPINLSIGQPDFPVPQAIKDAANEAIQTDRNGYTPTNGILPLREIIAAGEAEVFGRAVRADDVLITSGVSGGLFLALLALINPGDEVIVPDPYFVMYKHLTALFGGTPVYLDTRPSDFLPDPAAIEALITPRTKAVVLNAPSNPTGRVADETRTQALAAVCDKHNVLMISDEIYRDFAYVPVPSLARYSPNTLTLGGHSKTYGMTGWRLGFATGPSDLLQAMTMVQQYSFVCAPAMAQYAALAAPQVDVTASIEAYRAKRDLVVQRLQGAFDVAVPDGAFYCWLGLPEGVTGTAFAEAALKHNCIVIPGGVFSERDDAIRICYTVSDEKLAAGCDVLLEIVSEFSRENH